MAALQSNLTFEYQKILAQFISDRSVDGTIVEFESAMAYLQNM